MFSKSIRSLAIALAALTVVAGAYAQKGTPQASIVLNNSAGALCHHNDTEWTLAKTVTGHPTEDNGHTVTFTVTVTRGATSHNFLVVDGYVSVTNGGGAPATIGNIVVNLQKKVGSKYVSQGADCANATAGDAATSAKIVAAASQELTNGFNYIISGAQGTFSETAASGSLEFTDADNNTIFSLTPQQTIAPGATVNLKFQATFDNNVMLIPAGASVRAEVIVSFGNAGARGGSGATATNIDINGNGVIDGPEANVRSVPTRLTMTVPNLEACNGMVTLTDPGVSTTGDVVYGTFDNGGIGTGVALTDSAVYTVTVSGVTATNGGTITNTAYLDGEDTSTIVNGPLDPITGLPIFTIEFPCCVGVHLQAPASEDIGPGQGIHHLYTTYSQGGWGGRGAPADLLVAHFANVYATGVEVGIAGAGGFSMKFTTAAAVGAYLPAGGSSDSLDADLVNPTDSSSGVFGGQVLALQLSVDFSNAGWLPGGFGAQQLHDLAVGDDGGLGLDAAQAATLNGKTVSQVLAEANTVLGGGAPTFGLSIDQLQGLCALINLSYDNGTASAFGTAHL